MRRVLRTLLVAGMASLCVVVGPVESGGITGSNHLPSPVRDRKTIVVPLNKSRIIDLPKPVARVSVANPAIADILVVNPTQIYVVGKELGTTNMVLWDDDDRVREMMSLEVTHDLQTLKEKMYRFMPGEKVRVESAQGAIVLSGEVSSATKMDAALRLAQEYSPGGGAPGLPGAEQPNVLNLLQVGGAQQVLLEVKVAEISRELTKRLDIDFKGLYDGGSVRMGLVSGGLAGGSVPPSLDLSDTFIGDTGAFLSSLSGNFFFNVVVEAAKTQGLAKILAEPNLTTLSGQEAKFIAGGEFAVTTVSGLGNVDVEYKEFGVILNFVPFVLESGLISLKVNVSVSEPSTETTPVSGNVVVPTSLRKRGANSTVEVPSGQTIAMAGLLNEDLREQVSKFPGLGDLPILGALFRSQEYEKGQTELVIFVTPRLARPFRPELAKLPTDDFVEPNDTDFYLMGRLEGQRPGARSRASSFGPDKSGTEGPFGHDL